MLNQIHLERWAEVLVRHATKIRPGNVVRLMAEPAADPLVQAIAGKVLQAGGHPIVNYRPEFMSEAFYELANENQLDWTSPAWMKGPESAWMVSLYVLMAALSKCRPSLVGSDCLLGRWLNSPKRSGRVS